MDGGGRLLRSVSNALVSPVTAREAFAGSGASAAPSRMLAPSASRALVRGRPVIRASERVHRRLPTFAGTVLLVLLFSGVSLYGAVRGGQYADFVAFHGEPLDVVARTLGFGIESVTIAGIAELDQTEVLQVAGVDSRGSLPFFDVTRARDRLMAMPLVREATVRKLYPGALAITLAEREPFALWQNHGEVSVVAADGTVIDSLNDPRFNRLPLVVGEGANTRATLFSRLMDAHPDLKPYVRAGVLVGERRWTLKLANGVDVRLPETDAGVAMTRLSALIRDQKILDKDVLAIDLRQPDRVVLRLSEEAVAARAEMVKARPKLGKGSPV